MTKLHVKSKLRNQKDVLETEENVVSTPAEVVEALKGQDISVEGITSKGIANTGAFGNIGNVAFSGGDFTASSAKIFENIKDAQGNNRFIEGDIVMQEVTGIEWTYNKWSLSGTHLMFVIGFHAEANASLSFVVSVGIPEWVKDKIYAIYRQTYVDIKSFVARADEDLSTTSVNISLQKLPNGDVAISTLSAISFTKDSGCRIQFDLIIDNASE